MERSAKTLQSTGCGKQKSGQNQLAREENTETSPRGLSDCIFCEWMTCGIYLGIICFSSSFNVVVASSRSLFTIACGHRVDLLALCGECVGSSSPGPMGMGRAERSVCIRKWIYQPPRQPNKKWPRPSPRLWTTSFAFGRTFHSTGHRRVLRLDIGRDCNCHKTLCSLLSEA